MVYRIYVEKKAEYAAAAAGVLSDLRSFLKLGGIKNLRIFNRYDAENISPELFSQCRTTVFSEPAVDDVYDDMPVKGDFTLAVEYLPGQFDQRADSCAQCIQIVSCGERPLIRTAKIYVFDGEFSDADKAAVRHYLINPVECREASLDMPSTLVSEHDIPTTVPVIDDFLSLDEQGLKQFVEKYSLAMDNADIKFCQDYFASEKRNPTLTEIRMIDTYWSDHCRHTTFLTGIDGVEFEDDNLLKPSYDRYLKIRSELGRDNKPVTLMELATAGVRYLKKTGRLAKLDESEEINACTVVTTVKTDKGDEEWLLLFKNETHNHPTEIEPFGGAATCIGGAIRDPLSGRSYVYQAMRVTGAADPRRPLSQTMKGKLPQRKIVTSAADGYSSYGNQIGLATGLVDEIYHDGYAAKRLEIGAVVGAVPRENVVRETPDPGDIVILLGGRTGRDGCGGATGSSKSHNLASLEKCSAEVQKGNAPEERKLQRLFRNKAAVKMIKRCNDFGAGGVSVAIGELADGLKIDLNAVPKKYDGLDGTELAISESQERMAVVVRKSDVDRFKKYANDENLEATVVAEVTADPRLVMTWNGVTTVDVSREFLNSNGAPKKAKVTVEKPCEPQHKRYSGFAEGIKSVASDLNVCSKRGLAERFDSTIGAGSVLMPFGGKYQLTPSEAMAAKFPVLSGETDTCSVMAYGFNPGISECSPYHGAYCAVAESLCKLAATGAGLDETYLTFQEYFERLREDPKRWGKPVASLLGALDAQLDFGIASIGGKDSMSGSFEDIDVPPTLVSFAITVTDAKNIISPEFKKPKNSVTWLLPDFKNDLPVAKSMRKNADLVTKYIREGKIVAAHTVGEGGVAAAVMKMSFGNRIGFAFDKMFDPMACDRLFVPSCGSFILEWSGEPLAGITLGETTGEYALSCSGEKVDLCGLQKIWEDVLEDVYPCNIKQDSAEPEAITYNAQKRVSPKIGVKKPKVLIPVFPGTNCEYDSARAMERSGADPEIFVIRNLSAADIEESVDRFAALIKDSQIIFVPGGFSGGDEPDGSGKFITAFLRNPKISAEISGLLNNRDGLMCGICNGFQALIKLGLVPFGEMREMTADSPTLTTNIIGRHQSRMVYTRVASNKSPWLMHYNPGDIMPVPVSHGEGRFVCSEKLLNELIKNGQIATQYVDPDGRVTMDVRSNPNGSVMAVEGITSADGRILGKMGHTERTGRGLYRNIAGNTDLSLIRGAVDYFKI